MSHLSRLGSTFRIPIKADEQGYVGRECPEQKCQGYFKITLGTGLKDSSACYCAYCGHKAEQQEFCTRDQLEYAKSVVFHKVTDAFIKDLKSLEFTHPPRGSFGIGLSMKVKGTPHPIHYFREKHLETEIVCDRCTLRYAVYGEFAFCPDCGAHNSLQILNKNLELVGKLIALAEAQNDQALRAQLISDALENVVSAFDGFAREACRVHAHAATAPQKAENVSFQDLAGVRTRVQKLFGFDPAAGAAAEEWELACRCFQKRHLLAHKMGVIDEAYQRVTKNSGAVVGRKVMVQSDEVTALAGVIRKIGAGLLAGLESAAGGATP